MTHRTKPGLTGGALALAALLLLLAPHAASAQWWTNEADYDDTLENAPPTAGQFGREAGPGYNFRAQEEAFEGKGYGFGQGVSPYLEGREREQGTAGDALTYQEPGFGYGGRGYGGYDEAEYGFEPRREPIDEIRRDPPNEGISGEGETARWWDDEDAYGDEIGRTGDFLGAPSQDRGIVKETPEEAEQATGIEEFEGNEAFSMAEEGEELVEDSAGRFGEAEIYPEAYRLEAWEEAFPLTTEEALVGEE